MRKTRAQHPIDRDYRFSLRKRLSVLFSPIRLTLFLLSIAWLIAANIAFIDNGQKPEWLGPLSVVPVFACAAMLSITDGRERRKAAANAEATRSEERQKT